MPALRRPGIREFGVRQVKAKFRSFFAIGSIHRRLPTFHDARTAGADAVILRFMTINRQFKIFQPLGMAIQGIALGCGKGIR
ncbi:hypothetical protein [Paracoccus denitrificans]|uniref:hypothetical protein n=1 Tax=Paracoccus denitrificans TaxID=266 RepID=UPI000A889092|nr:hypothetical protein [Paracoccus denitrificans]